MSNVIAPIRTASVLVACLLLCATASAQRDDWHLFSHDLFVKSSFAHGYMHGYEEGFHNGDLDIQMGRQYHDVKGQDRYKKPVGYKVQFGDKGMFEEGYRHGFTVGYIDAFAGRSFRAAQLIRQKNVRPMPSDSSLHADRSFDSAFKEGYESGQKQGLKDGRSSVAANENAFQCDDAALQSKGGNGDPKADYCEAFRSGFHLGYSDGFANQRQVSDVVAKK